MNLINYLIFILPLVEICDASRVPAVKPVKEDLPQEIPQRPSCKHYVIYMLKTIRNGLNLTFTIQLMNDANPMKIVGNFQSTDGSLKLKNEQVVQPETRAVIHLGQVPLDYNGAGKFELKVEGFKVGDDSGDNLIFSRKTWVYETTWVYKRKSNSILTQTDKAIYKPGQTVKFRAFIVSPDLLPLNHTVTYEVRTPEGTIVMMRKNQPTVTGVVFDEFQLHPTAREGKWKIIFTDDVTNVEEAIKFEVAIYKLPKFEVKVNGPSYITADMEGITVQISSKYTHGQPVKGRASCSLQTARNGFIQLSDIKEFHGDAELFITRDQVTSLNTSDVFYGYFKYSDDGNFNGEANLECRVFEQHTDIEMTDVHKISLTNHNIKIEELLTPSTYKPGLNYTAYLKITEYDGKPLMDDIRENNEILAQVRYTKRHYWYYPSSERKEDLIETRTFSIPPSGIVPIHFKASNVSYDYAKFKCYGFAGNNLDSVAWTAHRAKSPSMNFVQISTEDNQIFPGEEVDFTVTSTENASSIEIIVLSRGRIVATEAIKPTTTDKRSNSCEYKLLVTYEMQPSITVLASYIREDGEVVADSTTLNVEMSLLNKLNVSTSSQKLDAGDHITINITSSSSHNFLALRAIDTSVLLLADGNDVTTDVVKREMDSYTSSSSDRENWWWWPTPSTAKTYEDVFDQAGINIIMDDRFPVLDYVTKQWSCIKSWGEVTAPYVPMSWPQDEPIFWGQPVPMSWPEGILSSIQPHHHEVVEDSMHHSGSAPTQLKKTTPRKNFPESWLWLNELTDEDGKFELKTNVPDTITSWEISAISMSPTQGLAIAEKSKVTVFRNFFVNLNLPLKVIRGEIIIVQAIVFNYFPHGLQVTLQLHVDKDDFEFLMPVNDEEIAGSTRVFTIPPDNSKSVRFPIRMTSIGDVSIKITAQSEIAYDSLIRTVHVKPEGIEQCFSQSQLFSRSKEEDEELTKSQLEIKLPQNIVPDSASVTLHVYGDVMGSTINNLGELLKTPTGCGEQNMVNFAPNVFITLYLERTNKLTEELKRTAYKHFSYGYQNQLNYQRRDGSFSAFGNRDKFGSLWLTAFVLKCFKHATKLEDGVAKQLDQNIKDSVQFITQHLNPDGTFKDRGTICHRELQGGVNSGITMAAYVTIALMEVPDHDDILNLAEKRILLNKTLGFLETHLNSVTESPYELSIVTYALHLLDSNMADEAFNYLNKLSNGGATIKFWSQSDSSAATYKDSYMPGQEPTSSRSIEMTSYALLTYLKRGEILTASSIMKWLASKQNSLGGYGNTQDTVLAIQAMASMAEYLVQEEENLKISFKQVNQSQQEINLTENNSQVYNRFDLHPVNGMLDIEVEGVGIGVAQLSVCYNIIESPYTNTPFDCYFVDSETDDVNNATLKLCCSLREPSSEPTGMLLYKVNLPSGFGIDVLRNLNKNNAKKVEFEKGSANLYFDELLPNEEICGELEIAREQEVAASKPATITVQDYYRPKRSLVMEYSLSRMEKSDVCEICGENCAGCTRDSSTPINYTAYTNAKPSNYTSNETNISNATTFNKSVTWSNTAAWNNTAFNNSINLNSTTNLDDINRDETFIIDSSNEVAAIVAAAIVAAAIVVIALLVLLFL